MKTKVYIQLPISLVLIYLGIVALGLQSCNDTCEEVYTYTMLEPVYRTAKEIRATTVTVETPRDLVDPGKIYFKQPYIFINEKNKGIHVINNSNNRNPQNVAFLNIPGNVDIAVRGNVLYADSYIDLLAIDISDPQSAEVLNRVEDAFAKGFQYNTENDSYIVSLEPVEYTDVYSCEEAPILPGRPTEEDNVFVDPVVDEDFDFIGGDDSVEASPIQPGNNSPNIGIGGSLARFTLYAGHLYVVTQSNLQSYSLKEPSLPTLVNDLQVGWNIETVFPFEGHLLIGSQTGMFIYNLDEPALPNFVSQFQHVRSCDPVVAEGNYAYVTLRSGTFCQGFTNQLDVLDISDLYNPLLVATYPMTNPAGLGIDDGILFICDGNDGLKIYNAEDPETISQNQIAHFPEVNSYDVIPYNNTLFLIGEDGFYQYRYDDENIVLLSQILVTP